MRRFSSMFEKQISKAAKADESFLRPLHATKQIYTNAC